MTPRHKSYRAVLEPSITPPQAARVLGEPLWLIRDTLDRLERRGVTVPRAGLYRLIDGELFEKIKEELERIKVEKEERRKASRKVRGNRFLTCWGETLHVEEWEKRTGIAHDTIWVRVHRLGWPVERALTEPVNKEVVRKNGRFTERLASVEVET
jgi:hypothetical protein